jgi:hypothetical protein
MAGNSARSSSGGDPLADLARLVSEDRTGAARRTLPSVDDTAAPRFEEEDLALRGSLDDVADVAYPPEAYAGVPYDGADEIAPRDLRRRHGGTVLAAVVLVFAVIGGGGVYAYRSLAHPHRVTGTPPVIKASTEPVKVAPKPTVEAAANRSKLIYDRVNSDAAATAHVVGGAEEPGERPVAVTDDSPHVVLPGQSAAAPAARVGASDGGPASPADAGPDARAVKTIAIQPDGNVVLPNGAPPLQPGEVAPPGAPLRGAPVGGSHIDAATQAQAAAIMAAVADPKAPVAGTGVAAGLTLMPNDQTGIMAGGGKPAGATSDAAQPAPAPTTQAAVPSAPATAAVVPLPTARPADLGAGPATRPVGAPIRLAPTTAHAAPPPRTAALAQAPAAASGGSFMVQLSAQRSEADAQATFRKLQARYSKVLGRYQPVIAPVTLADRGTFYRVRVGAFRTHDDATTMCEALKAAGGTCIVQAK